MPTDGADFGRIRPCYGKAFIMMRDGADDRDVAECVMRGVEFDIRRDGGAPSFGAAVELLLAASITGNNAQILDGADLIRRMFVDSPLTRHFADATEKVGLLAIADGRVLSRQEASILLLSQVATNRCCEGITAYGAKHRTKDLAESRKIVESIKSKLSQTTAGLDLAERMSRCSEKGIPPRAAKTQPVSYSAADLNEEELGGQ